MVNAKRFDMVRSPHKTRQAILFSLVGILPMLVLCGISYADFVNPFDILLNRQVIKVVPGQVVTIEKELAKLTFPLKFTLAGALPQGEVEYFAMLGYQVDKVGMLQQASANPFDKAKWKPMFFPWYRVDRFVPYKTDTNALTKITFDGYQTLTKEDIEKHKIFTLLFAIAPNGKVQKLKLNKAVMVRVNLK